MKVELFIANKLFFDKSNRSSLTHSIIKIAVAAIALGITVMIIAIAVVTGFQQQIREKVIGFGSHISIVNLDPNISYELKPVNKNQNFYPSISQEEGIKHIQVFAIKAGIIKTKTDLQGVVFKGIDADYDWSFFEKNLVEGKKIIISDDKKTDNVLISRKIASMLKLKVGDNLFMYFIQEKLRPRKFKITGIYETGLEEYDKLYVLGDIKHVQKLNKWTDNQISGFEVLINEFDQMEKMTKLVNDFVGFKFNNEGQRLRVKNIKAVEPQIFDWLQLTNTNVWVILTATIIVAIINMISAILILILERTNMIGILKALGAKNWTIQRIFLINAAFLIGKGLLWGNIIGIALCLLQQYFGILTLDPTSYYVSTVPINLKLSHLIFLNAGTLLMIVVVLILPSFVITRISPIKAIRFE